jgi:hypothetical protein
MGHALDREPEARWIRHFSIIAAIVGDSADAAIVARNRTRA